MTELGFLFFAIALLLPAALVFSVILFQIVFNIFKAVGLAEMMNSLNLKGSWMLYFPFLKNYAFGKIAEQYVKKNGKKSAKFSVLLFIVGFLVQILMSIPIIIFTLLAITFFFSDEGMEIFVALLVIGAVFVILFYSVFLLFEYIALYRIFAIFSGNKKVIDLILSIIFYRLVAAFLIFKRRNNQPIIFQKEDKTALPVLNETNIS